MLVADDILDAKEVAKILKVNHRTVTRWAEQGMLPAFRLGDLWRFKRQDIDAFIEEQESKQQQKEK